MINYTLGAIVLLVVGLAIRGLIRNKKTGRSSCGCDCASCGACCECGGTGARADRTPSSPG